MKQKLSKLLSKLKKRVSDGIVKANKFFSVWSFLLKFAACSAIVPVLWLLLSLAGGFGSAITMAGVAFILTLEFAVVAVVTVGPVLFSKWFITTVDDPKHIWLMPLFCTLENGRSKAIVDTGDNLRRHVMNYNNQDYARDSVSINGKPADIHSDEYWEVVPGKGNVLNARNWWEAFIESATGLVFVGVYPLRRVLHRPVTLCKIIKNSSGKSELVVKPGRSKKNPDGEMTDHARVREFDWGVLVTIVLKGFFRFRLLVFVRLQTTNPNKLLFGIDDWSVAVNNALEACIVRACRGMTPEELMDEESAADRIKKAILGVVEVDEPKTKTRWGLNILQAEVMDYDWSPLTTSEQVAMTAVEVSKRTREATVIAYDGQAVGQANVIGQRAQKMQEYGKDGLAASEHEAIETAAEKGATLFVTVGKPGPQNNEDTLNAILAELRKERK